MRQLIARVDDELHRRLKAKASSENRSLNELVTEALSRVVDGSASLRTVRQRARSSGMLVEVEGTDQAPDLDELEAETRGFGRGVGQALEADRGEW
ncbi:toxin-antitoxin system HicB family antitoxin [Actinopolyspora saharensis]|uniref:HicB family protein n=1 Tax=Actinopolyspora saharensis TaxID=995062 RepID=A0A1H1E3R5_9ACTN|nr:toxin-antitoxin system HicB family antitoxin [Actinopolyspora saharensis]SDQ83337.1 HicB family protein [Actinopolyspora saharensis]